MLPSFGAADIEPGLTTDQIVKRLVSMNAARTSREPEYRAIRHYVLDYEGFPSDKHAEMTVQVISHPPQKEFTILSESGSKVLLNRVLHKAIESEREANDNSNRGEVKLSEDNYKFQLVGTEAVEGRPCYVLLVEPRRENKFLYVGKIWVDAQDFAVVQIMASPAKNPSFWISSVQIEHRYEKHGDIWLPRSHQSTSKVRLGGSAVLKIDYGEYEFPGETVRSAASTQGK